MLWIKPSGVPLATLTAHDLVPLGRTALLAFLDQPAGDAAGRRPCGRGRGACTPRARGRQTALRGAAVPRAPRRALRPAYAPDPDQRRDLQRGWRGRGASPVRGRRRLGPVYGPPAAARSRHPRRAERACRADRSACPGDHADAEPWADRGRRRSGDRSRRRPAGSRRRSSWRSRRPRPCRAPRRSRPRRPRPRRTRSHPPCAPRCRGSAAGRSCSTTRPRQPCSPSTPAGRAFVAGGPLTPDQIVYAGSFPLLLDLNGVAPDDAPRVALERVAGHAGAGRGTPVIVVSCPGRAC